MLLEQIGVSFTQLAGEIDETPLPGEVASDYVMRMAVEKAQDGWKRVIQQNLPGFPVLAADTSVVIDNDILGKPADADHAYDMLVKLRGRSHQVMTTVSVSDGHKVDTSVSASSVVMAQIPDEQIRAYIATGEPMDKAGGYGIQGLGAVLVERIEGSYSGIMGLPLHKTAELLKGFGVSVWQNTVEV